MTKPPAGWKSIPYVESLGIDLDRLDGPVTLFDGTAREEYRISRQREYRRGSFAGGVASIARALP